jgi:hypothetical protein
MKEYCETQFCYLIGYEMAEKDAKIRRLKEEAVTMRKDLDEATQKLHIEEIKSSL